MRTIEEIKEFINGGCYYNISWDDMMNGLSDKEIGSMREYYLNSDIPFKNECIMEKGNMICIFMLLMACEYLIDDDILLAKNICDYID